MQIGKGRYGDSITKAGERSCVYEIDMRRGKGGVQRRPHTISGAAGLSRAAMYLQTMPSAAAFQWVLAKKACGNFGPCWQISLTHFISLHRHRQEFHPSISCIASPSLHLALYTRASSLSTASAL
jgi:hypothetical protein